MRRRAMGTTAVLLVALSVTLALGLSTGQGPAVGTPPRADGTPFPPHVPGEVIVAFRDTAPAPTDSGAVPQTGALAEIATTDIESLGSTGTFLVGLDGMTVEEAIDRLAHHPDIAFVEPNYLYSTQAVPNDPQFELLWGLENTGQTGGTPGADVRATEVWEVFRGTRATLVAVIDTGVDYNHPDLAANIWTNPGEVPDNGIDDDGNGFIDDVHGWDFVNDDNDPMDDHFHGTHVAGTIGAVGDNGVGIVGMNWEVSILPLKFLDDGGIGTTAAAIGAVDYAVKNGARILNNSWGGSGFSQALRLAIERADRENVLFVAAAGNNLAGGRDNDFFPFFPATYPTPNIIAVAATDHDDALGSFSNFGREAVDLSAPGVDVYSTFPGNDYGFLNGTSMATPHVAGALALLLGRYPEIAAVDAKALVLSTVDLVPELAGVTATGGRLNASRILSDPDIVAPAATTDLRAGAPDANRVDLAWTATGDDGLDGTASRYDVRFAPFPIDAGNFDDAMPAAAPPRPAPPGATERLRVTGLDAETMYWFSVQILDEFGNRSPLSNVVQVRTLGPPAIRIAPDSIGIDLFTGESAEAELSIENLGIGELIYDIVVEGISPTAIAELGNGRPDMVTVGAATAAVATPSVGIHDISFDSDRPHAGSHLAPNDNKEVTDATAANGSTYSYHEFNAPAGHFNGIYQELGSAQPVYISFWVRPGSTQDNDAYFVIRDSTGSDAIFFYATSSGTFQVNADVGGNSELRYDAQTWYHVEFREIDFAATTFDYYVDGILIQPGVRFRFPSVRDLDRLDLYSFDGGAEAWWDEIVLTALPPVLPIEVVPASGVLPAAGRTDLSVRLDATGLNGGVYDASLIVASNDPLHPSLRVPVQLRVTGAPDVRLSEDSLDFGALFVGDRSERTITIDNRGTDLLEVARLAVDHPDFSVEPGPFELAPGESRELTLAFLPTVEGAAAAQLTIDSNDPDDPMQQIALAGVGLLPPDIEVAPGAFAEALITGGSTALELAIRNTGFSDLFWKIAYPGDPHPTLESALEALDDDPASITSAIPGLHPMTSGRFGPTIPDGGANMFDIGNFLSTDRGGFLEYTNGAITEHELLGETGRFFTRKYSGLFVLAADLVDTTFFNIAGSVGAGAVAFSDEAILQVRANGLRYRVYVMRSSGTARPSVNHMVIVEDRPGTDHRIQTFANQYSHVVYGLGGETRLYYLLFGGSNGRYYDDATLTAVAHRFFDALHFGPEWLQVTPRSGRTAPSETTTLRVDLDAFALDDANYESAIRVLTNVPVLPEVGVPVALHVDAAADIAVAPTTYDFGDVFVGQSADGVVAVSNHGTLDLNVSAITSDHPAFSPGVESLAIVPGDVTNLALTFAPADVGAFEGHVTLVSDDPDEAAVTVTLHGIAHDPPIVEVDPIHLDVELDSGTTATSTLLLRNLAGADLTFEIHTEFAAVQAGADVPPSPNAAYDRPTTSPRVESARAWKPAMSLDPRPTAKAGEVGEAEPNFFFFDGFEDGLLDGWLGLAPGASGDAEIVDPAAAGRRGHPGRNTHAPPRTVPGTEPTDVALAARDTTPAATTKGAIERLSVTPSVGIIAAGGELPLAVTVDADRLLQGDYSGVIRLSSNDPTRPEIAIGVSVHVTADPIIGASPQEVAFGDVPVGLTQQQSVTVSNFGFAALTVDAIVIDQPDFTANVESFMLPPGRSRAVGVEFRPNGPGPATATLTLFNNSPQGEFPIALSGNGVQGAEIVITPEAVDQIQFRGEAATRTLTIRNRGGEPLDYSITLRPHTAPLTRVTLFEDDLESENDRWTAEAINGDNLWSRNDLRFNSESHAWTCTATDTGTYATDNPISAAVISPPIDLRSIDSPVKLRFFESFTTEPGWDQCMVDASIDGGDTWVALRGVYGAAPSGSSRGWTQENLSLTPFAGEIVRLRYYFETLDAQNNAFPGWSFDDVRVESEGIPWIAVDRTEGTLNAGEEVELAVTFTALDIRPATIYAADIEITTSAALTPLVVVPARLDVRVPPRAALEGAIVRLESDQRFFGARARTDHHLDFPVAPAGSGTVFLEILGNFATAGESASLTAEAFPLGALVGSPEAPGEGECRNLTANYPVSGGDLARLAADGVFDAGVRNSADVDADCTDNRHRVALEYVGELQRLDFGEVRVGDRAARPLLITNTGGSDLLVTGFETATPNIAVEALAELVIPPLATIEVTVLWSPADGAPLDGTLVIATNDPQRHEIHLPLGGTALAEFPEAIFDTTPLVAALPPGSDTIRTRSVLLRNAGSADLDWIARPNEFGPVEPMSGVLAPGASVDIAVHFSASTLEAGDYTTTFIIDTNDPVLPRIEIPLILHVGQVGLDVFTIDFTPKYATREGTVEVVLQLPEGFDAANVLTGTVTLLGIGPDSSAVLLRDTNRDGVDELVLQFDAAAFEAVLPVGDSVPVATTGEIDSQAWFRDTTWIRGRIEVDPENVP